MKRLIFTIVFICVSLFSYSQSYWYYGTVEDLENGSYPIDSTAVIYTNDDYMTYDAVQSTWYNLDTSVEKLKIPYAEGNIINKFNCIAVPVSSGINDILDNTESESLIGNSVIQSNKIINGIEYIVWTGAMEGRLIGYLVNSNPTNINNVKKLNSNNIYTLNGYKLNNKQKGLNIINGKKYYIKN